MDAAASAFPPANSNDADDDAAKLLVDTDNDDDERPAASGPAAASFCVSVLTWLLWPLLNTASTVGFAAYLMLVFEAACLPQSRFLVRHRGVLWRGVTRLLAVFLMSLFFCSQVLHDTRLLARNFTHNSNGQLPSLRRCAPPHDWHINGMASNRIKQTKKMLKVTPSVGRSLQLLSLELMSQHSELWRWQLETLDQPYISRINYSEQ